MLKSKSKLFRNILCLVLLAAAAGAFSITPPKVKADTTVDQNGCTINEEKVQPTDKDGVVLADAEPILITEKSCPATEEDYKKAHEGSVPSGVDSIYLGCNLNKGASMFGYHEEGSGRNIWNFRFANGSVGQVISRVSYCEDSWGCLWGGGVNAVPSLQYTSAQQNWSSNTWIWSGGCN